MVDGKNKWRNGEMYRVLESGMFTSWLSLMKLSLVMPPLREHLSPDHDLFQALTAGLGNW